ncbi:hypothetical protein DFH07DRAFT_879063 [Mycena maculata]|uniref:DUF7702 domain-containing protein n=1 Tax=Mycena maculata TaxID=230809 RepID=A0AAD7NRS5_9AGAR|nr:hypothetical protein DFH07DRAFT_879063 [Mycena maculata]
MSTEPIDYAALFGFHSVAGAAIFAALYVPLFLWFIRQSIKNATYVYIVLVVFCLIRVVAFVLRAILAGSTTAGENLGLLIAAETLFGVGFFALLYSAYTLVLDRELVSGGERSNSLPMQLMRQRRFFRLALLIGVILGVVGTSDISSSSTGTSSTGTALRKASTVVFLVLTVLQLLQASVVAGESFTSGYRNDSRPFGDRYGSYLICVISLLLLIREVFLTATTLGNTAKQADERLWFPLVALPEILAVMCYSISGLVPSKSALTNAA